MCDTDRYTTRRMSSYYLDTDRYTTHKLSPVIVTTEEGHPLQSIEHLSDVCTCSSSSFPERDSTGHNCQRTDWRPDHEWRRQCEIDRGFITTSGSRKRVFHKGDDRGLPVVWWWISTVDWKYCYRVLRSHPFSFPCEWQHQDCFLGVRVLFWPLWSVMSRQVRRNVYNDGQVVEEGDTRWQGVVVEDDNTRWQGT